LRIFHEKIYDRWAAAQGTGIYACMMPPGCHACMMSPGRHFCFLENHMFRSWCPHLMICSHGAQVVEDELWLWALC
jgi:hypothetical protein